jgi:hypothetical protein
MWVKKGKKLLALNTLGQFCPVSWQLGVVLSAPLRGMDD